MSPKRANAPPRSPTMCAIQDQDEACVRILSNDTSHAKP